ncbi:Ig domain-containing protein [Novosphingobium olei]|uniref:Ig domain-containing protein n=1 Tax=Novosphingobium olei TaxID=2728851 RepID=UPI0030878A86|nr:hypothetical protein NSDW_11480 [Novosphingobium olei]
MRIINASARGSGAPTAKSAYLLSGTGVVGAWATGLTPPLTVARDSGSTAITFGSSGSQLTASISTALAAGSSISAVARVTQADGVGVLIPVTLTGQYAMAASPSTATVSTSATPGTLLANLSNVPTGQTPTISPNDGRLVISGSEAAGWKVSVGLTAASAGAQTFTISAAGASVATVDVTFSTAGAVNLVDLALSTTLAPQGSAATININNATLGSTITVSGTLPPGMTLNSAARTITGTPTTPATYNFSLVETLAGAANSPRTTPVSIVVSSSSSIMAPAYNFSRAQSTPLYTRDGLGMGTTSLGPYSPCLVDVRSDPMYAGKVDYLSFFSTDHDTGAGGIWLICCYGDPGVAANWKTYDEALAAGWFANVTGPKPAGNPIFIHPGSSQTETAWVNRLDDGSYMMTYQVRAGIIAGWNGQLSLRAYSTNGLNFTYDGGGAFLLVPSPEIGSVASDANKHTGYLKWYRNPGLSGVPYPWMGYSLVEGSSDGQLGMWGANDPKGAWTWLGPVGGQAGPVTDACPPPGTYGPYLAALPSALRMTRQGWAGVSAWGTSSFGTNPTTTSPFEALISDDGRYVISQGTQLLATGAAGTYDQMAVGISNIISIDSTRVFAMSQGRNAADSNNGINVITSPLNGPEMVFSLPTQSPPAGRTSYVADYTTATAIPAGFTAVDVGTPSFAYGGLGKTATIAATDQHFEFGNGFVPNSTEYVDIQVENLISLITNSRHFALGFTSAPADNTVLTKDSVYVESHPSGSAHRLYKTLNLGGTRYSTQVDTTGPGFGSLAENSAAGAAGFNYSKQNKDYGLRWYVRTGRIVWLSQGVEAGDFSAGPVSFLDPTKTYYPFIMVKGVAASSQERIAKLSYSVKAGSGLVGTPFVPYFTPLVDLNYNLGIFRIGSSVFTSLAAFEADSRVTKWGAGATNHRVALPSTIDPSVGATIAAWVQTGTLPSGNSQWIAALDDGNDGVATDEIMLLSWGTDAMIIAQAFTGGSNVGTTTTQTHNTVAANTRLALTAGGKGTRLSDNTATSSGTGVNMAGNLSSQLSSLLVGGREGGDRNFTGSIKRVIVMPTYMDKTLGQFFATMM